MLLSVVSTYGLWFDKGCKLIYTLHLRYLLVMRKLQKTYRMEPAGSQGVWGLDDFQFLPFIWGSSQLIGNCFIYLGKFMVRFISVYCCIVSWCPV